MTDPRPIDHDLNAEILRNLEATEEEQAREDAEERRWCNHATDEVREAVDAILQAFEDAGWTEQRAHYFRTEAEGSIKYKLAEIIDQYGSACEAQGVVDGATRGYARGMKAANRTRRLVAKRSRPAPEFVLKPVECDEVAEVARRMSEAQHEAASRIARMHRMCSGTPHTIIGQGEYRRELS